MIPRAHVLAGPTASGKSSVAQLLAERHGLRILSADSMLVYRGMDIGTAKPSAAERGRVAYAGLDLATPGEPFNTALFLQAVAGELSATGWEEPFLLTGGTGLYIKALLHGFDPPDEPDPALRAELDDLHAREGVPGLRARLAALAPGALAALADPDNPRRLIRAIEIAGRGDARPHSWASSVEIPPILGLAVAPDLLAVRIARRVERMFDDGLLEETARLRADFPRWSPTALQAIGYAEAAAVLDGALSPATARERIAARTRQLAKRQRTWLRNQERVDWLEVSEEVPLEELADRVWERLRQTGPHELKLPAAPGAHSN